jgi:hypothetical protein
LIDGRFFFLDRRIRFPRRALRRFVFGRIFRGEFVGLHLSFAGYREHFFHNGEHRRVRFDHGFTVGLLVGNVLLLEGRVARFIGIILHCVEFRLLVCRQIRDFHGLCREGTNHGEGECEGGED